MPRISSTSKVTSYGIKDFNDLSKQLDRMYERIARGVNEKPDYVIRNAAPAASDYLFSVGTMWVDSTNNKVYILTSRPTSVTATWVEIS